MPEEIFKNLVKAETKKLGLLGSIEDISEQVKKLLAADFSESRKSKTSLEKREERAQG